MANFSPHVRTHDLFNVVCIGTITVLTFYYLGHATNFSLIGTSMLGDDEVARSIFGVLLPFFCTYVLVDTVWIILQPTAVVTSPQDIVFHHFATLLLLYIPFTDKQFQWHSGVAMAVEFQTLILVLRRLFHTNQLLYTILNYIFYAAWILFRLILNPLVLIFFVQEHNRYTAQVGSPWNMVLIGVILFSIITFLGFYWTISLALKTKRKKAWKKAWKEWLEEKLNESKFEWVKLRRLATKQ